MIIDNPTSVAFEVSAETRTIRGLALPFGDTAETGGRKYTFTKGSVSWGKVKVLDGHDWSRAAGTAELQETDEGIEAVMKIARGSRGDELLALAEDGVYDGLSVGLGPELQAVTRAGVQHVTSGTIREVSLTPIPAFENAAIRSVAASAADNQEVSTMDPDQTTDAPVAAAFSADQGTALSNKVDELAKKFDGLDAIRIPAQPQFQVKEKPIYRFDGVVAESGFDFSTDLIAAVWEGDAVAGKRVMDFANASIMNPAGAVEFMIDQADTAPVNPAQYRPDLFKDEGPALPSPMYDTFYAGAVKDNTPFFYSKLGTYDLGTKPHVEGVEPTEGSFNTVTGATITPALRSGRFGLTREVIDQGGNPQISGLIWNKVLRTHRLELEAVAAAAVKSKVASYGTLATPAVGADGAVIGKALKSGLVDLRFTADGQRFTKFFAAKDLYKALADAEDADNRPLYPILSPSNADGTTTAGLGSINVAGIKLDPTWSTSPGNASFYADPQAVKVWNSGLSRLDRVHESAAGYFVDFWFYAASHVYDETGVLKVAYSKA